MRPMPATTAALLAALLWAGDGGAQDAEPPFEAAGLRVAQPWANAAAAGGEALVYMVVENAGAAPAQITGATTPLATEVSLVGHLAQDGGMSVVPLPEILLEPGVETALAPDGAAIRLAGLTAPLEEGARFELTVITDLGTIPVQVAVEAADATEPSPAGPGR